MAYASVANCACRISVVEVMTYARDLLIGLMPLARDEEHIPRRSEHCGRTYGLGTVGDDQRMG